MKKYLTKIFATTILFILISLMFNYKADFALTVLENLPNEVKFVDIAAGYSHSLALDENGNIWAWGDYESIHMITVDGVKFKAISAGTESSLAIDTDGNLWGWGNNKYGQLVNGTTTISLTPIKIMEGTKFTKIAACWNYNLAIDTDGNLWAWGQNTYGQLGIGTTTNTTTPTKVKSGTKFNDVSGEYYASLAIDSSNNLWSFGAGQGLGIGTDTTIHSTPVLVKSGTKFQKIAAGESHSLAIDTSGNLWACGSSGYGVGDGTTNAHYTPIQIKKGTTFKEISAGNEFTLAIDSSNNLWAWGLNHKGQVGNGTQNNVTSPVQIQEGTKFIKVAAGREHSLALSEDGDLWVWGSNENKQLTTSSMGNSLVPLKITSKKIEYTVTFMDGTDVVKTETVTSGGSTTAPTLTKDGYTLSWDTDFSNVTSNLIVNAVWTPNAKNTVVVNTSEGEIEIEYTDEESIPLPQSLTKPGYTFSGWYDNGDFTGDVISTITLDDAQTKTYYAKWESDNITEENNNINDTNDINNNNSNNINNNNSNIVENVAPGILPQTGIEKFQMFTLIAMLGVIMFISFVKYKNLNI